MGWTSSTPSKARRKIERRLNRNSRGIRGAAKFAGLPHKAAERVPSDVFFWGAGLSVLGSLFLRLSGRKNDSLFVGEWAPTMLMIGVLGRLANLIRNPQRA